MVYHTTGLTRHQKEQTTDFSLHLFKICSSTESCYLQIKPKFQNYLY